MSPWLPTAPRVKSEVLTFVYKVVSGAVHTPQGLTVSVY